MAEAVHVGVDLGGMSAQIKTLDKTFAAALRKKVRSTMTDAGSDMVAAVRRNASWSSRIPAATSVKTSFSTSNAKVVIAVNHAKAPHARPLELGNKTTFDEGEIAKRTGEAKKKVNGRTVTTSARRKAMKQMKQSGVGVGRALRHPVYGHKNAIAEQATRPFFFPAAAKTSATTQQRMVDALDDIAREAGFK